MAILLREFLMIGKFSDRKIVFLLNFKGKIQKLSTYG
jgi:hypothetical protein